MLKIIIPGRELWDEVNEEFITISECTFYLEHSLVSISEWEGKYHKSFIDTKEKTNEEMFDYIKMMVVGKKPEDYYFNFLTEEQVKAIGRYIEDPMTATTFSDEEEKKSNSKELTTAETIYYYMTALNIPFECQRWHINKLIALIKLCSIKNDPESKKDKKLTSSDLANRRAKMEAARARWKSKAKK